MISFLSWVFVVVFSWLLCSLLFPKPLPQPAVLTSKYKVRASLAIAVLAAGVFSPLYYEYSNWPDSVVVTFKNGQVVRHPHGMFCVKGCTNLFTGSVVINGSVFALTENPKVRQVGFYVSARIIDEGKYFNSSIPKHDMASDSDSKYLLNQDYTYIVSDQKEIAKIVSSKLFDFKSRHSKELVLFDNPLDEAQNQRLKELIEPAINPLLEPYGIAIKFKRFTVE